MKAEIVAVGTELLLGEITDTNSSFLASQLPLLGIDLYYISQVGDNLGRVVELLRRALGRSDVVLVTGGLGPTQDDLTRESIAETLGETIYIDPELEQQVREFFNRRGMNMPESNIKQAALIPSARPLGNPRGTAPGWWVEKDDKIIIAMPGVPREMTLMWQNEVLPRLRSRLPQEVIVSRTFKTLGYSEAAVDEMVAPLLSSRNPTIGVYAKADGIHLRLTTKARTEAEARALAQPFEEKLRSILGLALWGADDDTLEGIIGGLLRERGLTVATMESCTGGLLANQVTDAPGSSHYFKGGFVAYTAEMKVSLGVPAEVIARHGVISAEVAEAMAVAARARLGAEVGIGITGVAGPEEVEGKPVGTVFIVIDFQGKKRTIRGRYPPSRLQVKQWATLAALNEVRRAILAPEEEPGFVRR